ncbi:MAG: hypothetical protein Q7R57_01830 [Dehalococcoidales bacterium]|nr:hypothetical protein [Dehalococcoidales bacterium]
MFIAQLHNKLSRPEQDMEDLLTSNVFGVWRYLPVEIAQIGLLRFLKTACRLDQAEFHGPDKIKTLSVKFWPWIKEGDAKGAEPDVLIEMVSSDQRKWLLLIESKYLSPKSSSADPLDPHPTDQLAREMQNLRRVASTQKFDEYALIYVTAHTQIPKNDFSQAISELETKTGQGDSDKFYWTTWRMLPSIISDSINLCGEPYATLLGDLREIICRMGLSFFNGMSIRGWTLGECPWIFESPLDPIFLDWQPISMTKYVFEGPPIKFSWISSGNRARNMRWRWKS